MCIAMLGGGGPPTSLSAHSSVGSVAPVSPLTNSRSILSARSAMKPESSDFLHTVSDSSYSDNFD